MTDITIYHNPRCSKSRQTLQLLRDRGIDPIIVEYHKQPLSPAQIKHLLAILAMGALIKAMAEHPQLMERPIVVAGERAALGRPPEKVLEIL
jgi:arsenate reductase